VHGGVVTRGHAPVLSLSKDALHVTSPRFDPRNKSEGKQARAGSERVKGRETRELIHVRAWPRRNPDTRPRPELVEGRLQLAMPRFAKLAPGSVKAHTT